MVRIQRFINRHFSVAAMAVFILAMVIRFSFLSSYPVSLTIDEVGFGYDAYSILKTGHDEWGERYPLVFRAIGDYKPAVDVYLTSLSVGIFGLNEFGERFPVAFLGALTCLVFILLLSEIGLSSLISIFGGFFLAISPWAVHFSRANFEATIALFFLLVGVWLVFLWSKRQKTSLLSLSIASFALSVWSYNAERLFTPILFIALVVLLKDKFKIFLRKPKKLIIPVITLLVFLLPFLYLGFFTEAIRSRPISTSIFREASLIQNLHNGVYKDWPERVFDNDAYLIFRHWTGKYLNYYDLRFWFWKALFTPPGFPDLGLLYVVDIPLFFLGVYAIAKSKNHKLKKLSLFWFFAGPLSASLTMNEQHPLRALVWIPFFALVISSGFGFLVETIKKKAFVILYFILLLFNMVYFADIYIHHFPRFYSEFWQYGYKEVANYACQNLDKYDHIVITDTFGSDGPLNTGVPPLYLLFYCEPDRNIFLSSGKHSEKLLFRRPTKEDFTKKENMLLIGSPWDFLDELANKGHTIKKINFLNGKPAFIFKTNR